MISKKDEKNLRKMLSLAVEPDEALTYDEMLGFLFGVAITPDIVMLSEWLPKVLGEEMITVDSDDEANRLFKTLMCVVNDLTARFQDNTLHFPFDLDAFTDEMLGAIGDWAYGLNEALQLRADCWLECLPEAVPEKDEKDYDEELVTALAVIKGVARPDEVAELLTLKGSDEEELSENLLATLFVMLPKAVSVLLDHAKALERERQEYLRQPPAHPPQLPKIGRNDPCPCGSGRKYKKCCMHKTKIVPIR
jgi:uncharacterized protein